MSPSHPPVSRSTRAITLAVGAAGVVFAAAMIDLAWQDGDHSLAAYHGSLAAFVIGSMAGITFLAAGLVASWQRPDSLAARLMVVAGALWYASNLQFTGGGPLYAIGYWLAYLPPVIVGHLALLYPENRLRSRAERLAVGASYACYLTLQGIRYLVEGSCNTVAVTTSPPHGCASPVLSNLVSLDGLLFTVLFSAWVLRRWWVASGPARRVHGPAWLGFTLLSGILLTNVAAALLGAASGVLLGLLIAYGAGLAALPFAFLSGLARVRLARQRVADLVLGLEESPGPARLRELLANALGDPGLVLGLWSDASGAYIDGEGLPVTPPEPGTGRAATRVEGRGHHLALLVHDPSLLQQRPLVEATVAAARLALENGRLAQAALAERRSIERDLHDGLQHRLLRLSWLADRVGAATAEAEARPLLDELAHDARDAYAQLRELARGIHPAVLTERGLAAAVEEQALRIPVPLVVDLPPDRWSAPVEAVAYFTVAEAVTNAVKHAAATAIVVRGRVEDGRLTIEVADDGTGGADPRRGTGLRGLQDRAAALGGAVTVHTGRGRGTRIELDLPCA